MSRVFDALSQAEEHQAAVLRAQVTRIVQEADLVGASSENVAARQSETSSAPLSFHIPDGETSLVKKQTPSGEKPSVTSIIEYAPLAPSEETRRRLQASLASAIEGLVLAECRRIDEQRIRHDMRELWSKESVKFASQLEIEFGQSLAKAAARQDLISNQMAKKFCDALHEQLSVAVSAFTSWIERKREALELEFQKSLSRFSQQVGDLNAATLANQQRESKALSADLSSRLQRAARALEEAGLLTSGAN